MKCVITKNGSKLLITIGFKGEIVYIFAPKRLDSIAADLENKF